MAEASRVAYGAALRAAEHAEAVCCGAWARVTLHSFTMFGICHALLSFCQSINIRGHQVTTFYTNCFLPGDD